MSNSIHTSGHVISTLFGTEEIFVEDYCVNDEGLYSPLGHRIGDPLLVVGNGAGNPTATAYGLSEHKEGLSLLVGGNDPVAIGTALVLSGYHAEIGRMMEVTDFVRSSWAGGSGPIEVIIKKDRDALLEAVTAPKSSKPASAPAPQHRDTLSSGPDYMPVRDIPWLKDYFRRPASRGLHQYLGRELTSECRRIGRLQTYTDCGAHAPGMYPRQAIDAIRARLDSDPAYMEAHR